LKPLGSKAAGSSYPCTLDRFISSGKIGDLCRCERFQRPFDRGGPICVWTITDQMGIAGTDTTRHPQSNDGLEGRAGWDADQFLHSIHRSFRDISPRQHTSIAAPIRLESNPPGDGDLVPHFLPVEASGMFCCECDSSASSSDEKTSPSSSSSTTIASGILASSSSSSSSRLMTIPPLSDDSSSSEEISMVSRRDLSPSPALSGKAIIAQALGFRTHGVLGAVALSRVKLLCYGG
ncbi:hypothetical protein KCU88_g317, partial [Aureobasidium melanogenum]